MHIISFYFLSGIIWYISLRLNILWRQQCDLKFWSTFYKETTKARICSCSCRDGPTTTRCGSISTGRTNSHSIDCYSSIFPTPVSLSHALAGARTFPPSYNECTPLSRRLEREFNSRRRRWSAMIGDAITAINSIRYPLPLIKKHPGYFDQLIAMDVPAYVQITGILPKLYAMTYQLTLIIAFLLGGTIGRIMTRAVMKLFKYSPKY